jgi:hypothetical protein
MAAAGGILQGPALILVDCQQGGFWSLQLLVVVLGYGQVLQNALQRQGLQVRAAA